MFSLHHLQVPKEIMSYDSAPLISKSHLVIFLTVGNFRGSVHVSCKDVTLRKQNCCKHLLWNGLLVLGPPEWTAPVISSLRPQGSPLSGIRWAYKIILEGTGLGWGLVVVVGMGLFLRAGFNFVISFSWATKVCPSLNSRQGVRQRKQ